MLVLRLRLGKEKGNWESGGDAGSGWEKGKKVGKFLYMLVYGWLKTGFTVVDGGFLYLFYRELGYETMSGLSYVFHTFFLLH